jgi:hypothetical protein
MTTKVRHTMPDMAHSVRNDGHMVEAFSFRNVWYCGICWMKVYENPYTDPSSWVHGKWGHQ